MAEVHGFWVEGKWRHHEALKEAEKEELVALQERLFFASPTEKVEVKLEIKSVRKKYRDLRKSTGRSLYFGAGDIEF